MGQMLSLVVTAMACCAGLDALWRLMIRTPAGALFAAGVLSWLAADAGSVEWWDPNNYGNDTSSCTTPDYGFVTSSSPPVAATPYYGYLLASVLARPSPSSTPAPRRR
ncbi:MAG TPA: hypothetical protein VK817_18955 [Trebonia sp.]|jgi:hypothetical protein|nr:hypothetical protein [Trebonia sp.]